MAREVDVDPDRAVALMQHLLAPRPGVRLVTLVVTDHEGLVEYANCHATGRLLADAKGRALVLARIAETWEEVRQEGES